MADIPEDVRNTAYAMSMRLMDHDRDSGENAEVIAEAILAERERCAKIAGRIREEVFAAHQHERAYVAQCIEAEISAPHRIVGVPPGE